MVPDGIKLPSDSTVASQGVRRNDSTPLSATERPTNSANKAPPNPLATVVLQSKPILEGQKGGLFQLILQNDPKSDPPIKVVADTPIKPGTPLLVELDGKGQYQPVDRLTRTQLTKLISLELEFWQAHLFPKAANKLAPPLPSLPSLQSLLGKHPELQPLIQWVSQRPQQLTGQHIQKLMQEFSPLASLREPSQVVVGRSFNLPTPSSQGVPAPQQQGAGRTQGVMNSASQPLDTQNTIATKTGANLRTQPPTQTTANTQNTAGNTLLHLLSKPLTLTRLGNIAVIPSSNFPRENRAVPPNVLAPSVRNETLQSSVFRAKQITPKLGMLPSVSPLVLTSSTLNTEATEQKAFSHPISSGKGHTETVSTHMARSEQAILASLPKPSASSNQDQSAFKIIQQLSSDLLSRPSQEPNTSKVPLRLPASELIELKIGQWIQLIEQTQSKTQADLTQLLKSKALALINEGQSAADKIQIDPKTLQKNAPLEDTLAQLRSWLESTQAKVFHQAVQTAATQWQLPELPAVQQMQLPLIWLGLTSWADIEWWQEKKKKLNDSKNEERERRWRMRVYLSVDPLSEFCADIDWHSNDTQLIFWSEDAATLSHLNSLIPTLVSWTQGLSSESVIQTRHGMPKRVSKQQLQHTNHHLVDIKT